MSRIDEKLGIQPNYEDLANAIIEQAGQDYIKAVKSGDKYNKKEIEEFFNSKWFNTLSNANGSKLIQGIQSRLNEDASFNIDSDSDNSEETESDIRKKVNAFSRAKRLAYKDKVLKERKKKQEEKAAYMKEVAFYLKPSSYTPTAESKTYKDDIKTLCNKEGANYNIVVKLMNDGLSLEKAIKHGKQITKDDIKV